MAEIYGDGSKEAAEICEQFAAMDTDRSGKIDYNEFVAATFGDETILNDRNALHRAFQTFDMDDDGFITMNEIKELLLQQYGMTPEACEEAAKDLVQQYANKPGNGLDFEDFLTMMKTVERHVGEKTSAHGALEPGDRVVWISLDPRSGSIYPYPRGVARAIEAGHKNGKTHVDLGEKVIGHRGCPINNAKVVFTSEWTVQPFQATLTGRRDVRRVVLAPGQDMLVMGESGDPGVRRFDDNGAPTSFTGLAAFAVALVAL